MCLTIDELRGLCTPDNIYLTLHASKRLETGEIIEEYPNDYPYPSCLTLGNLNTKCPLHVVVGSNHEQLWIITAYYPSSDKWESDLKTRKEN